MRKIVLVDAGTGNLRSVQKALEACGALVERTSDPQGILAAETVVLPGVGAFGDFMAGLRERGLDAPIRDVVGRGAALLGICVGMQALFEVGEEMGQYAGLSFLPGRVVRFPGGSGLKVPHTGWNQIEASMDAQLFAGLPEHEYMYFNHSYFCQPSEPSDVCAITDYGGGFACSVQRGRIFGVQFHPEKSQSAGLQVLRNFLEAA